MNDNMLKLGLGKILGEIYRTQKRVGHQTVPDAMIFGLLEGVEDTIDAELFGAGLDMSPHRLLSTEKIKAVCDVLDPYVNERPAGFGYYTIEKSLADHGVDRGEAMMIIKWLLAGGRYTDVIQAMDNQNSPGECRTFELHDEDSYRLAVGNWIRGLAGTSRALRSRPLTVLGWRSA